MAQRDTSRPLLSLEETAAYLDLPATAVVALARGKFLPISDPDGEALEVEGTVDDNFLFRMVDLKAFLARNADYGSGNLLAFDADDPDPQALVVDLDARSEEMARRAFDIFSAAVPEARRWSLTERARFISQAKARFEAILAVTSHGAEVDEALIQDLQEVGAAAAWAQSPLPQLLMVLRISRDLVVQTAVELAEERGGRWGLALSLLLTRVLPAMDRLIDALATGYWGALARRDEAASARYAHVVEHSSDGIWEIDLDGRITYANAAFALMVGHELEDIDGALLTELLPTELSGVSFEALTPTSMDGAPLELSVRRPDGVRRVLAVRVQPRLEDDIVVGFQGV
ncbi:MAG TPA: PAS domain S-box protein, partial [Acidimicrobiales bacterium]|nr:PAS domain S-box protein [Acidimicrobiales bacterium]